MPDIRLVDAVATRPLRQRVLRPHQTLDELAHPRETEPDAGHFAAFLNDEMVGTVSIGREARSLVEGEDPWRLRAVAVSPGYARRGIGTALVTAAIELIARAGGDVVWCDGRISASGFYEALGLRATGEVWDEPFTGPHRLFMRRLDAMEPPSATGAIPRFVD